MTAAEFEAAGLFDPASPKASERLELLQWLDSRGIALEQMQQANEKHQLPFVASIVTMRPGPYLTQQEFAERLGSTLEIVEAFRIAFGLPPVAPGDPWCNESEADFFASVAGGIGLFGTTGMLRLSRVIGSSVARIADAMATTNHERMRAILASGASELAVAKANLRAVETADAPMSISRALLPLHLQIASIRVRDRRERFDQPTVHGCVGFVDLVGSTTLSRQVSVSDLADIVDRFEEVANEVATNRRGQVVKFIGDEVMFVTGDAASACDIALTLIERFADDAAVTPRAGLAEGEMLDRGGDYYGPVVNLAARLAELAVPSEVLASAELAEHASGAGLRCESAGRRMLRGFDKPVSLMSVSRA
jgi:class 3 adenylate cyclase